MQGQFHKQLIKLLAEGTLGQKRNTLCLVPVTLANSIPLLVLGELDIQGYYSKNKN